MVVRTASHHEAGWYLYISIHDNHTIDILTTGEPHPLGQRLLDSEEYQPGQPFDMISLGRVNQSQIFYDEDYIRKHLSKFFDLKTYEYEMYGYQTGVLLQKGP
jgi:hypothetical protein